MLLQQNAASSSLPLMNHTKSNANPLLCARTFHIRCCRTHVRHTRYDTENEGKSNMSLRILCTHLSVLGNQTPAWRLSPRPRDTRISRLITWNGACNLWSWPTFREWTGDIGHGDKIDKISRCIITNDSMLTSSRYPGIPWPRADMRIRSYI